MPEGLTQTKTPTSKTPAGFKSECRPVSFRNRGRLHVGIPGRNKSESATIGLVLQLGDLQLLLCDQRFVFRRFRAGSAAISKLFARSTASASLRAATSFGTASRSSSMRHSESQIGRVGTPQTACIRSFFAQPALCGRQLSCGFRQSIPSIEGIEECPQ